MRVSRAASEFTSQSGINMNLQATDVIGRASKAVPMATVGRQAWSRWKEGSTAGQSKWFFVGQLVASSGFVACSWRLDNIVFVVRNLFLLLIAAVGQVLYLRNREREGKSTVDDT
jgi:hypothetical protein